MPKQSFVESVHNAPRRDQVISRGVTKLLLQHMKLEAEKQ